LMGNKWLIPLDRQGANLERDTQGEMFECPNIKTWGIFYLESKVQVLNDFKSNL
jgi:hypothetical protein